MKQRKIVQEDTNIEWKNSVGWKNLSPEERMVLLESEGKFDIDINDDPPTYELLPDEIYYEQKKLGTRVKFRFANWLSHIKINGFIKNGMFAIKEIKGLENWQKVKTGAILTCNHFGPTDTFIMQKVLKASKKRRMLKVVREGNYTNPPVLKFFLRNCGVLPLSSNGQTMRKFLRAVDNILQVGDNILVYPEESLWPNYRKPRPLKDGAFKFAVKNNVPVVPVFITMEEVPYYNKKTKEYQPMLTHTVHILEPIYPKEDLDRNANIAYMKNLNYDMCVKVYEDTYGEKLTYNIKNK